MNLIMIDDEGNTIPLDGNLQGDWTTAQMLIIFAKCVELQRKKALTYGEAYRSQGYMGNMARVLSKVSRLKNMVWRDFGIEDSEESVLDSVGDLINLAAFFVINYNDRNKWGDRG